MRCFTLQNEIHTHVIAKAFSVHDSNWTGPPPKKKPMT
jgi:hypothetical protein